MCYFIRKVERDSMPDIVTVGEILVEIMAERRGQSFLKPGTFLGPYPSGAPAIFVDQAARMGVSCGIVSRIGNDPFGTLNLKRLQQDGVDTTWVTVDNARLTGIAFVTYREDGEREFIYHFKDSAIGNVCPDEIPEEYIASARYLHVMGCTLLAAPQIAKAVEVAAVLAKRHGVKLSFDPNIRPELLREGETKQIFERILGMADIILTGAGELRQITGEPDLPNAVSKLRKTAEMVVIKNGSRDTTVYGSGECFSVHPFTAREVDPTGAGDCFDGAFLAALVQGYSLQEAAEIGCAAGALAVQKQGPMEGASWKSEIEALRVTRG